MDLKCFDEKCVRITTAAGEVYEGTASYCSSEYSLHEYGRDQEALLLVPFLFYEDVISSVESLENVGGPFGHFSEAYGLLERECMEQGTDMIGEVLESDDDIQILRMLTCMSDNFRTLADRAVPGTAPWCRDGSTVQADDGEGEREHKHKPEPEHKPVYLGELERMLDSLVQYSGNRDIVKAAGDLLTQLSVTRCDGRL